MVSGVVGRGNRIFARPVTRSRTAIEPLPGGDLDDVTREIAGATAVVGYADIAERLVHAHGSAWRAVWALVEGEPDLRTRVSPVRPYLLAELRYAVEHELARTFGDLLIRRTPVAFETIDHGRRAAPDAGPYVASWLGWDERELAAALAAPQVGGDRI